jgi:S-adenosylhomocysteine hydrolase
MNQNDREDLSSDAVARLLAIAPALLATSEQSMVNLLVSRSSKRTDALVSRLDLLLDLISDCLKSEPAAITAASHLINTARLMRPVPSLQLIAATDFLHRSIQADGDAGLRAHAIAAHRKQLTHLELVDVLRQQFKVPTSTPLANANILACRHLLGTTVAELSAIQTVLPAANFVEVMGKPYSANLLAVDALAHLGLEVSEESYNMPDLNTVRLGTFAHRHRQIAENVVERFVRKHGTSSEPLIVIDDGGALISAVGRKVLEGKLRVPVVAVEQTTHGMFAVQEFLQEPKAKEYGFALISVADSVAKLDEESPLIAQSVIDCATHWLELLRQHEKIPQLNLESSRIGIVGYGPIGALVAEVLPTPSNVTIFDRNRRKLVLAKSAGYRVAWSLEELLGTADIVIAASGGTSLDADAAAYLRDGTVLMSASSGDKEFAGLSSWSTTLAPLIESLGITAYDRAHGLLTANHADGRTVYVVNRAFPVNFDGSLDPIDPQAIQLTRALIVGAILQAAGASQHGPLVGMTAKLHLNTAIDSFIADMYRKLQRTNEEPNAGGVG